MPRTRTLLPEGVTTSSSPMRATPANTVPVTTVPAPASVKQRSTASRNPPRAARRAEAAACVRR